MKSRFEGFYDFPDTLIDATNSPAPSFEVFIMIMGEAGAGKSTLINLIGGKPGAGTLFETSPVQEYTCTYQDKDTHFIWNLHLFDTPACVDDYNDEETHRYVQQLQRWKPDRSPYSISSIIYCHNINQARLTNLASRLMHIYFGGKQVKNVILCTTQWDMLVDKSVGERRIQELEQTHWCEMFNGGTRLARHDNTRKSVEEILRLIIDKEFVKLLLLKELGLPKMTLQSRKAFRQNYEGTKRLILEIRNTQFKETADRAKIKEEAEEYRWQQKVAHMSAELDRAETAQEKELIELRIEMEMEDQKLKRKMWKAIRRAREERIENELYQKLTDATGFEFIANPTCATSGDPRDEFGSEEQNEECSGIKSKTAVSLSRTDNHCVDNHVDANDESSDDLVPLRIEPHDKKYVITPELASKKIQNLDHLLDALNEIFDTNIPISYPGVQKTLEYLASKGHDLGAVYAHIQVIWPTAWVTVPPASPIVDNSDCVIGSPELASRKCQNVDELLSFLNMSFDTNILRSKSGIEAVLTLLVDLGYTFGDICTHMQDRWPKKQKLKSWLKVWKYKQRVFNVWEEFQTLVRRGEEYEDQRQQSFDHDTIRTPSLIKPRRIWDLYAHRVIPFQFSAVAIHSRNRSVEGYSVPARLYFRFGPTKFGRYHPVSHSWTEDMSPVDSPVNAFEWPVPLPPGVTLDSVRNELLSLGAQYVWLDVVCLRQKSLNSISEALRRKEWKIDVPTIGSIYKASPTVDNVIRYFNGLGKEFRRNGWQDKTHWSQRAWTLQEFNGKYIEAGLPRGVKDPLQVTDDNGILLRDHLKKSEITLGNQAWQEFSAGTDLRIAIAAMKWRHSRNPVDKIFGLSTLLDCKELPVYLENEREEHAWSRLIKRTHSGIWTELLFGCPLPGKNQYWRPSWSQLMADSYVIEKVPHLDDEDLSPTVGNDGRLACSVVLIKGCQVSLSGPYSANNVVILETERQRKKYKWKMVNLNPQKQGVVPGVYTLAGCFNRSVHHWVLCRRHASGELGKVSVLQRSADEIQGLDIFGTALDVLPSRTTRMANSDQLMCSEDVVFR